MTPPRAIFFDVMDTLVRDPFHHEMPAFFGLTKAELIRVKHPTAWVDFELGVIDEAAFLADFLPGRDWDREGFRQVVRASYQWLPGMRELVDEVRARPGRPSLHALSNYPPWYAWIDERCDLRSRLDSAFLSCEMGVRKPDAEAYLEPCRAVGIAPGEALFVDDRASNCDAARAIGMDAVVFADAGALRSELARRGVI
ncbi:MAG: HAD family phosphatase [Myxococcota bacterium]|nr:HAD family phosphatase [Myxococcota bacterium]